MDRETAAFKEGNVDLRELKTLIKSNGFDVAGEGVNHAESEADSTSSAVSIVSQSGAEILQVGFEARGEESGNLRRRQTSSGVKASDTNSRAVSQNDRPSHSHAMTAATPAHKNSKESPLSSTTIFYQSHAGLFNLCLVLLLAVNSRLIIENLMKYGFLMRASFWASFHSIHDWPLFMCGVSLSVFPALSLIVEKLTAGRFIPETVSVTLHILIVIVEFLYPAFTIHIVNSAPMSGIILIFFTVILWMKLVSFAHTNYSYRHLLQKQEAAEPPESSPHIQYPNNLTVNNMSYFLAAPTLCYQLWYPRSDKVRRGWIVHQLVKLAFFLGLMLFIIEQYINPIIQNSVHPLKGHFLYSIERVLKLSIPTVYVWLCMFYCFFHLWLNIVAEVTQFGDREFYKDWWNATTIEEYWRRWNMPVHKWMLRHLYFPCINCGLSKTFAMFLVFMMSAVFHEVLVGIPCHMLRMWAFLGIAFQIPLVYLTKYLYAKFKQPMVGNMLFWFFFCIVGQPVCILLYYHDVQVQQQMQHQH